MDSGDIRGEALRYLGYRGKGLSPQISERLDEAIDFCLKVSVSDHVRREFRIHTMPPAHSPRDQVIVHVDGTVLELRGGDIRKRLLHCESVTLFAATLGYEIDRAIERVSLTDKSFGLMLNAAAAALIERYCDTLEREIAAAAYARGMLAMPRFSPGYGDLPLSTQLVFLDVLDANRRLGITCNAAFLMFPRKSVTAIIGHSAKTRVSPLFRADSETKGFCAGCTLRDSCEYKHCIRK